MVYCHHIIIISSAFCSHFHSVCCPRPSRWGCRSIHPANPTSARKIGRFLLEFCHYWHQYPAKKLVRLMLSAFDCPTDIINIYIYSIYYIYVWYICLCIVRHVYKVHLPLPHHVLIPWKEIAHHPLKKNGSLNSEWCLEEQFNAELLAEKHRLYCWIHWKKQILSKLHLWTYEHAKPIVDVTSQDWIGSFCDDHLSVFNAIVTGQYATLNMESYFNSGRVPRYIQVGVNPT